jgi:hypothetical protein
VSIIALSQVLSAPIAGISVVLGRLETGAAWGGWAIDAAAVLVTLLGLVIAAGLWRLKRWAWVSVMLWTGATLATALFSYLRGHPDFPPMMVGIVTVFYLNQGEVQRAFNVPLSEAQA